MIAWKKGEKTIGMINSHESETWKQRLSHEKRETFKQSAAKILELQD